MTPVRKQESPIHELQIRPRDTLQRDKQYSPLAALKIPKLPIAEVHSMKKEMDQVSPFNI